MNRFATVLGLLALFAAGCGDDARPVDDADSAGDADVEEETDGGADADADADADVEAEADRGPVCGDATREGDEECDDGNATAGDGCETDCTFSCHDDIDCDDGLDCTADGCGETTGGRVCRHDLATGVCLIDGGCVMHDTADPANPCLVCDPGTTTEDWTPLPEGTSCADALFCNGAEFCSAEGACITIDPGCGTGACVDSCDESTDTCIPAAAGTVCRPALGVCDFDEMCDGTTFECPADELVDASVTCRPPVSACDIGESCTGVTPECPVDAVIGSGVACDDGLVCSTVDACDGAGRCAGIEFVAPGAPVPLLPHNGLRTGSPLAPTTFNTLRPMFRWQEPPWDGCASPTYELQIDDSCTTPGFTTCGFPSPELSEAVIIGITYRPTTDLPSSSTAPVGRRYYWRIQACRGTDCSAWSAVRYFDAGRVTQDFNGDGYSDVVAGAPGQDGTGGADEGAAFVFFGSASGTATTGATTLANPEHEALGGFGLSAAAAGDLNADGFADLVVGAPTQDAPVSNEGRAFVYLGSASGLPTTPSLTLDNPAAQAEGQFGVAVAGAGDVDGDGFDDLLIGAHRQDGTAVDEGAAWLFYGSATGAETTPGVSFADPGAEADAQFGRSVATAGDVNADGFADIIIGAPYQDGTAADEGRAFVYLGAAAGPSSTPTVTLEDPGHQAGAHFGWSVATAGDINVNGFSELLVGAPVQANPTAGEGNVFVYYGSPTGVPATASGVFDNPGAQDGGFGFSVAGIGDVNADVNPDVAFGALYQDAGATDEGNAFVFHGCYCGVIRTSPVSSTLDNPDNQAGGLFGQAVSGAGDVNGDGFADLVVGALAQDGTAINEGLIFVYHGSTTGIPTTPTLRIAHPGDQANALFGSSVD
jgi:cysteine-rich repeat protein